VLRFALQAYLQPRILSLLVLLLLLLLLLKTAIWLQSLMLLHLQQ
jgi:quinol-cytochrome oxidoreductase complex cytochrome b subunit